MWFVVHLSFSETYFAALCRRRWRRSMDGSLAKYSNGVNIPRRCLRRCPHQIKRWNSPGFSVEKRFRTTLGNPGGQENFSKFSASHTLMMQNQFGRDHLSIGGKESLNLRATFAGSDDYKFQEIVARLGESWFELPPSEDPAFQLLVSDLTRKCSKAVVFQSALSVWALPVQMCPPTVTTSILTFWL